MGMEEDNSDEDLVANPEFVQILAPFEEVNQWISSFIEYQREQINLQNIQDFCVAPISRQNCARVDAVLVKRKGTTSHITVKDIKNYCGPQEKRNNDSVVSSQSDKVHSNKKVFTSDDVDRKMKELQYLYNSKPSTSFGTDEHSTNKYNE